MAGDYLLAIFLVGGWFRDGKQKMRGGGPRVQRRDRARNHVFPAPTGRGRETNHVFPAPTGKGRETNHVFPAPTGKGRARNRAFPAPTGRHVKAQGIALGLGRKTMASPVGAQ